MSVEEILREVNALPPDEYARLMDSLVVLMHTTNPEVDRAWGDEVERRIDDIDSGQAESLDGEEFLQTIRKQRRDK